MAEALIRVEGVRQVYEGRKVLRIDRLEVFKGEILALVGPSGAGKSTLLRLLNFLEPPSRGAIYYKGLPFRPGQKMPLAARRQVTTVFQRPHLLNRTVAANVAYGLRLRRYPGSQARVREALEEVGLSQLADQRARTLSGGEAQRVALARALVIEPEVLLLDEPTANLDPYNVDLIEKSVAQINRERGMTIVLVTHNVFQARRLAQRVGLLLDGRLVEIAGVKTFFEAPVDPRTAAFTGGEMVY
jgi:tungstate transport system ATP-binding protein